MFRVLAFALTLGLFPFAATAAPVTSLQLDFRFDSLQDFSSSPVFSPIAGQGIGSMGFGATPVCATICTLSDVNIFNDVVFRLDFGSSCGASDVLSLQKSWVGAEYSGLAGSTQFVATGPLFLRMTLVSGSVDPARSFTAQIFTPDFTRFGFASQLAAVPLPASALLLLGGVAGLAGLRRRSRA